MPFGRHDIELLCILSIGISVAANLGIEVSLLLGCQSGQAERETLGQKKDPDRRLLCTKCLPENTVPTYPNLTFSLTILLINKLNRNHRKKTEMQGVEKCLSLSAHIVMVLSSDPEASWLPSGLKDTDDTLRECPVRLCFCLNN